MIWTSSIRAFLAYLKLERNMSANTISAYQSDLKKFVQWAEDEKLSPAKVSHIDLSNFLHEQHKQGIAARSQARVLSSLRALFGFLLMEETIDADPTELLESPKLGQYLPEVMSEKEIDQLIAAIDLSTPEGERNRAMLEVLYGCGLRVSELISLKISDLQFRDGYILVTGKGNKQRIVPINKSAIKFSKIYLEQVRPFVDIKPEAEDILFLNRRGRSLSRVMIFNIVKNLAEKAGLHKNVSPHTFRHSFASHLVNRGANLRVVQDMLGHESITTTEIYTHLNDSKLRDTIEKFHPRS